MPEILYLTGQHFQEYIFELFAPVLIHHGTAARVRDRKRVQHNPIVAREDLCAQDVNTRRAKRARNLAEKAGAIPRANFGAGIAAIYFIVPDEDWFQGLFLFGELVVHETM